MHDNAAGTAVADTSSTSVPFVAQSASPSTPRWIVVTLALLCFSVFINYIDRGNLSTAAPLIKNELNISATQLGFLLTSFFVTYSLVQLVAGWLVDRFDAGRVLLAGFILWSLTTSATGLAQGLAALFALRLLLGAGESVAFPVYSKIITQCFPENRRGIANAAILASMAAGPAFGIFAGGIFMAVYGWRAFFIGFGLLSLLWIVPWLAYGDKCLYVKGKRVTTGPSIGRIVRERSLWGSTLGHFCGNYNWYFVLTWIPYYLVFERHRSFTEMATIGGIAYLLMGLAMMTSGWLADRWIRTGVSPTRARKTFLVSGACGTAIFMIGCVWTGPTLSIICLFLACIGMGMSYPNVWATIQTLAGPHAAGRWTGIQNGLGNAAGIVAPALTGILVDRTGYFLLPFMIAAAMGFAGALAWAYLVGPVKPIDWSRPAGAR